MQSVKELVKAGVPAVLVDDLHKIKVSKTADHEVVCVVCGADGAQAAPMQAYELHLDRQAVREFLAAKSKAEFREIMLSLGIKMPEFRAILRSRRKVRQDTKSRRKFLRRNEKHILSQNRKNIRKDIKEAQKLLKMAENQPEVAKLYEEEIARLEAELKAMVMKR